MKEASLSQSMRILANMLESRTGQSLSDNRMWRMETSLRPVLRANGLKALDELVSKIVSDQQGALATEAVDALLNNETSFFRDNHIFQMVARDLLPHIIERGEKQGKHRLLRVWCAGCSSGQEAYSLAMTFLNNCDQWSDWRMQILATDVSAAMIDKAKSGVVSQMDVQRGLAINDLLRWVTPAGDDWKIDPSLREMIDFRVDNLLEPSAPAGEYDIILCRNVLLYFSAEHKQQIFGVLAKHSGVDATLLLGAGETTIGHTTEFSPSPFFRGSYQRNDPYRLGVRP